MSILQLLMHATSRSLRFKVTALSCLSFVIAALNNYCVITGEKKLALRPEFETVAEDIEEKRTVKVVSTTPDSKCATE